MFWIAGIVAGIIFITPKLNGDKFMGGYIGCMISLLLSFIVFPELRNMLGLIWNGNNMYGFQMKNFFTHPTQKPAILGMLWFIIFILISVSGLFTLIADNLPNIYRLDLTSLFLLPTAFLFGLSGFLMIKRKEMVGRFGAIHKGFWATFTGILLLIFSWGGIILVIFADILNW